MGLQICLYLFVTRFKMIRFRDISKPIRPRKYSRILKTVIFVHIVWLLIIIALMSAMKPEAILKDYPSSWVMDADSSSGANELVQEQLLFHRKEQRRDVFPVSDDIFKPTETAGEKTPRLRRSSSINTSRTGTPAQLNKSRLASDEVLTSTSDEPGALGLPVRIVAKHLSGADLIAYREGYENNAYNEYASNLISLHRALPDHRYAGCKSIKYPSDLPRASVLISFHNEAWSVLLRTVHSVLNLSPARLLKEVILIDDFSDRLHLKSALSNYVSLLSRVKLIRTDRREGLIRARLFGAAAASGDVLIFLDSHSECVTGWLQPLLFRIYQNRTNVVTPVIDVIDDNTFAYQFRPITLGTFNWNLQFIWRKSFPEDFRVTSYTEPVRSATMAGGLFAIDKKYFYQMGTYDPGMEIWGGENLEMSFRIWMCGGSIETIPCSHVAHIYRKRNPYVWKSKFDFLKKNTIRLAEVWLDEYKELFYERIHHNLGDYGDVSDRKTLRKLLNCKSFKWYLENVATDVYAHGKTILDGEIRNKVSAQCLDAEDMPGREIFTWPCHAAGGNQLWHLSKHGDIRRFEGCLANTVYGVRIQDCSGKQYWTFNEVGNLIHQNSSQCLTLTGDLKTVQMRPCVNSDNQIWFWKHSHANQMQNPNQQEL